MPESHYSDRILVVDDAEGSMQAVKGRMSDCGFRNVTFASTTDEALGLLGIGEGMPKGGESPFDLVILNMNLVGMDGVDLCATLRMNRKSQDLPILTLTDSTEPEDLQAAFMAGVDDFVVVPIDNQRLMARVRGLLRLRRERARRELQERELKLRYETLQRERLDNVLVDRVTGLARGVVIELILRGCEENGEPAALALLRVVDFERYVEHYGQQTARKLLRTLSDAMLSRDAPLGAILCSYVEGVFMIVQQRAKSSDRLQKFCGDFAKMVGEAQIPHSNSHYGPSVGLEIRTGWASGEDLRHLSERLLSGKYVANGPLDRAS